MNQILKGPHRIGKGWVMRLKRSLYMLVPLDSFDSNVVLEDPWIIVPRLFSPCYIGGWTATEYWGFTEQIFKDIQVVTSKRIPKNEYHINKINYSLTKFDEKLMFGTKSVWIHDKKIQISDPHKTILDMLYKPSLGGGGPHIANSFLEYCYSDKRNFNALAEYSIKFDSGALFKRLGYLLENLEIEADFLLSLCKSRITRGYSSFDPKAKGGSLKTSWNLYVPGGLWRDCN